MKALSGNTPLLAYQVTTNMMHIPLKCLEKLYNRLKDHCPKLRTVYEWTNGSAAQYKARVSFADISCETELTIYRNFFETSHGKNVCDWGLP